MIMRLLELSGLSKVLDIVSSEDTTRSGSVQAWLEPGRDGDQATRPPLALDPSSRGMLDLQESGEEVLHADHPAACSHHSAAYRWRRLRLPGTTATVTVGARWPCRSRVVPGVGMLLQGCGSWATLQRDGSADRPTSAAGPIGRERIQRMRCRGRARKRVVRSHAGHCALMTCAAAVTMVVVAVGDFNDPSSRRAGHAARAWPGGARWPAFRPEGRR